MAGGRALLTATGRVATLDGHAELIFPTRRGIEASERVIDVGAQLRLLPTESGWEAVADLSLHAEHRERSDSIAEARTSVDGLTPRVALEVGRRVGDRLTLGGGYALARYGGSGTLPAASSRGPVYQRIFAPELDMATSASTAQAASAMASWRLRDASVLWVTGRVERLTGEWFEGSFAPDGSRTARSVILGVTLAP